MKITNDQSYANDCECEMDDERFASDWRVKARQFVRAYEGESA